MTHTYTQTFGRTFILAIMLAGIALPVNAYTITTVAPPNPSTCAPNFVTDGISIPVGCPNLFFRVTVEPSTIFVSVNDNPLSQGLNANGGTSDADYNDASVLGNIFTTSTPGVDAVYLSWEGALSAWNNTIELNGKMFNSSTPAGSFFVGNYAVGTELDFLEVAQDGHVYESLSTAQGANWFWESQVATDTLKGSTPEPTTALLAVIGLMGVWVGSRRRQ